MPGREARRLTPDEIYRLVAFEADAMAGPVRQARQLVIGAIAERAVIFPYGIVDASSGHAGLRCFECDLLALAHVRPDVALALGRLAEDEGAGNIRLIAFDRAAAVHQHDFPLAHLLGLARPVRIGACLAEQNEREFGPPAKPAGGAVHDRTDLGRRHAGLDAGRRVAIGGQRHIRRFLHQCEFGGRLDHPDRPHHRSRRPDPRAGKRPLEAVHREIADRLLDPDRAGT
jgi:hypothetical protein